VPAGIGPGEAIAFPGPITNLALRVERYPCSRGGFANSVPAGFERRGRHLRRAGRGIETWLLRNDGTVVACGGVPTNVPSRLSNGPLSHCVGNGHYLARLNNGTVNGLGVPNKADECSGWV